MNSQSNSGPAVPRFDALLTAAGNRRDAWQRLHALAQTCSAAAAAGNDAARRPLARQERVRHEMRSLRRPDDPFVYELVFAPSFEDGAVAAIFNFDLQAVVIYDGFPFRSKLGFPQMAEFLGRHLKVDPRAVEP